MIEKLWNHTESDLGEPPLKPCSSRKRKNHSRFWFDFDFQCQIGLNSPNTIFSKKKYTYGKVDWTWIATDSWALRSWIGCGKEESWFQRFLVLLELHIGAEQWGEEDTEEEFESDLAKTFDLDGDGFITSQEHGSTFKILEFIHFLYVIYLVALKWLNFSLSW